MTVKNALKTLNGLDGKRYPEPDIHAVINRLNHESIKELKNALSGYESDIANKVCINLEEIVNIPEEFFSKAASQSRGILSMVAVRT